MPTEPPARIWAKCSQQDPVDTRTVPLKDAPNAKGLFVRSTLPGAEGLWERPGVSCCWIQCCLFG